MSDIEWSPWIKHDGKGMPVPGDTMVCVRLSGGGAYNRFKAGEWNWYAEGNGRIEDYRIPMADYKRITGMPEWDDAPEWATHVGQNERGQWYYMRNASNNPSEGGEYFKCDKAGVQAEKGTVLGDWRDTLQERPSGARLPTAKEIADGLKAMASATRASGGSLDTHPDSELDADQYSVGVDTVEYAPDDVALQEDAAAEIVKRVQDRNLSPHNAPSFLHAALGHMQDRASTYDAPEGERSMGKTVAAFNAITGRDICEEEGWLFMVLLKAARTQQGSFRADNYEDGAAYFALQGEAAARARGHE